MIAIAKPETRRGIAFERLFRIAEVLRGLRRGLSLRELNREVSALTGHDWNDRTTRRDVALLEYLGVVAVDDGVCRWNGQEFISAPLGGIGRAADTMAVLQSLASQRATFEPATREGFTASLRKVIADSGQSANAIAKACGVPQNCLSRFIRGDRDLSAPSIERLVSHFGLRLA